MGSGTGSFDSPWVPIDIYGVSLYLLQFLSYLAGSKNLSTLSFDPDAMAITALAAIASPKCTNMHFFESSWTM